jgi:hypothetical protein
MRSACRPTGSSRTGSAICSSVRSDDPLQPGSWSKPRRVIAKVEWHPEQLYPRVGFIATNMSRPAERVVAFYNKRGTREQWIKESKGARTAASARLSGRRPRTTAPPTIDHRESLRDRAQKIAPLAKTASASLYSFLTTSLSGFSDTIFISVTPLTPGLSFNTSAFSSSQVPSDDTLRSSAPGRESRS